MDINTAAEVDRLCRSANAALNQAIAEVQVNCTATEFESFRSIVGRIMGSVVVDVLQPLYAAHPSIVPDDLR